MAKKGSQQKMSQSQAQIQTLSPQQVLLVRLLELNAVEIEDRVRSEIMENPARESVLPEESSNFEDTAEESTIDASSANDYRAEDDIPDYYGWDYRNSGTAAAEIPTSADVSFGEKLLEQLGEMSLDDAQMQMGEYLIGSLEEDGLLYKPLDEIVDELNIYNGIRVSEA